MWATSVPNLVFLGLSVLDLGPMYATDVRQGTLNTSRWENLANIALYLGNRMNDRIWHDNTDGKGIFLGGRPRPHPKGRDPNFFCPTYAETV